MKSHRIALLSENDSELAALEKHLLREGHEVVCYRTDQAETFSSLRKQFQKFDPQIFLFRNFYALDPLTGPKAELADFLVHQQKPTICWYVDNPFSCGTVLNQIYFQIAGRPKSFLYLCIDRDHCERLKQLGLTSDLLPLGADEDYKDFRASPLLARRFGDGLSFVGAAPAAAKEYISEEQMRSISPEIICDQLKGVSRLAIQYWPQLSLSESELKVYLETFEKRMRDLFSKTLLSGNSYRDEIKKQIWEPLESADSRLRTLTHAIQGWIDTKYAFLMLKKGLEKISSLDLNVYGSENWTNYIRGIKPSGPRLAYEELFSLFSSSKVSFTLTKNQFHDAVQERVFWIYALGGLPLCDQREQLNDLFDKEALVSYTSFEEAKDLAEFYLNPAHETERRKKIERGRENVLARHTLQQRMRELIAKAERHFGL